jgi:HK97 family phage major capsid protein
MKSRIEALERSRQEAVNAYRAIHDLAEQESRELTGDEKAQAEQIWADITARGDEIDREKRLADIDDRLAERREAAQALAGKGSDPDPAAVRGEQIFRNIVDPNCRKSEQLTINLRSMREMRESRANELIKSSSDTPKMGYTVPTTLSDRIIGHINAASGVLESDCTILTTQSGETQYWAALSVDAAASLTAEAVAATQAYPQMVQRQLDAYDVDGYFYVSKQLLADAGPDVEAFLGDCAGRAIATKVANLYAVGTGSSQPQGVNPVSTVGVTAAAADTFTFNELLDLYLSVLSGYRRRGEWILSDTAFAKLCKLKDDNGQYFYRPGEPLISRPVHVDADYPACTTGLKTMTFGDMSTFFIRNVGSVLIERDDSFAFTSKLATILFWLRTDSELMDRTGSVKHMIMA